MTIRTFEALALGEPILRALKAEGYTTPTDIQGAAIPEVLAGKDLLATAQTGTGKTAAFALPMLQMLGLRGANGEPVAPVKPSPERPDGRDSGRRGGYRNGRDSRGYGNRAPQEPARPIRALILTPTRELALQIDANIKIYGRHLPLRTGVLLGGVGAGPQIQALRRGVDILISTPGRLLDLHSQGFVRLGTVKMLVLDEADRMLDMGFLPDVRRIVAETPSDRQTLLFSATMSREITALASSILTDPWRIEVKPAGSTTESIDQRVLFVEQSNKRDLLVEVLSDASVLRALVFTRTKHRASKIAELLSKQGITADAIHGNKSQSQRQRALAAFDRGRVRVLVATDVASRGIDVDGISHVINYEMPDDAESYVHRIGRTARAGAQGVALSFCDHEEVGLLRGIEHLTKMPIAMHEDHGFHSSSVADMRSRSHTPSRPPSWGGQRGRGGRPAGGSRGRQQGFGNTGRPGRRAPR
jgi:ATP-dependent RNA helicase RhlE